MFRNKAWSRRAGVALALVVSLLSGIASLPHAEGAVDFDCNPIPVTHDEAAHYVGADPAPAQSDADHCFLCHSIRSFYSAFDTFDHYDNSPHAEHRHAAQVDRPELVEWTLVPGRAPPV